MGYIFSIFQDLIENVRGYIKNRITKITTLGRSDISKMVILRNP